MTRHPKVIGCVPAYQAERFIQKTLEALAVQTYPNFEIWICDDASQDKTSSICREFCQSDSRFKFFRNDQNLGWWQTSTALWKTAAENSEFCFLNPHDDIPFPEFISKQVELLILHPTAVLVNPGMRNTYWNNQTIDHLTGNLCMSDDPVIRIEQLLRKRQAYWWSAFHGIHRSTSIQKILPIIRNPFGEKEFSLDLIWLIKAASLGPFVSYPEPLFEKFYQKNSVSNKWKHSMKNRSALYFSLSRVVGSLPLKTGQRLKLYQILLNQIGQILRRKLTLK